MTADRPLLTRWLAALTVAALAATTAVVVDTSLSEPAHAAFPETFNPFAMNGGYTVYARENALLENHELEGSVAIGGVATARGSTGTFSIIHVAAGTGAYTLPTVDGDPTRMLVGSYDPSSTGILAITSAGTSDPSLLGDFKMVERDGPWQPFARASWLRMNTAGPANPAQTPLIDATAQDFPDDAAPPATPTGGGSIYTFDTSATAVADYVEAGAEATYAQADSCLADLADATTGTGNRVAVENVGDRVVLSGLSADQPNVVDYADIEGASLIQFGPGPTPGASNPLVIRVPAGTTNVVGARADPQGVYSPFILWDLSAVTGAVSMIAGSARIDGSVYAPEADLTVDASPLDGQILGENLVVRGGEVHSYLFAGTIACDAEVGTFRAQKAIEGIDPAELPAGTSFTVNYTATDPDGAVTTGALELPASGAWVGAGRQFPIGTEVTFAEVEPESVPGYTWGPAAITPSPLTIGTGTADVVVTNTATEVLGTFEVSKEVVTADGSPPPTIADQTIPVDWTATLDGAQVGSGTLAVDTDGTPVGPGRSFRAGTVIDLSEDASGFVLPAGWEWTGAGWDPGSTFTVAGSGTTSVALTNIIAAVADVRHITLVKSATGAAADPAFGYTVTYNTDPDGDRSAPVDLPVGMPIELTDVETGTDLLALAEQVPTLGGSPTNPAWWTDPVFVVTVDGTSTQYPSGGFDRIVDLDLGVGGDVSIEVRNALREGTFTLSKQFETVAAEHVPDDAVFTAGWTATTPTGEVTRGVLRLPADGTPVGPTSGDGSAQLFPFGTVIEYDELTSPNVPWLDWGTPVLSSAQLVIGTDAAPVVTGTITNSATLVAGNFTVVKELDGIDPDDVLVDTLTVNYTATQPNGAVITGWFELPVDGTPAGPADGGGPLQFPVGTDVRLEEAALDEADLPEDYSWSAPTWTPGNSVVIRSDTTPELTLTNSVVQLTRFSVTKAITGPASSAVPADTVFLVDWWQLETPQPPLEVRIGQTTFSPYIPVGTIALAEEQLPTVPGVTWGAISWTANGEPMFLGPDGRAVTQLRPDPGEPISFAVTNTANAAGGGGTGGTGGAIAVTGGGSVAPWIPLTAFGVIVLGAWLFSRRTRTL